jgi:RNA-directed DNA polymerase
MLYRDEDLRRTDAHGRHVYLLRDFDLRNGFHQQENVSTPNPKNKTLVREDVFDRDTAASVGLGKTAFATYVENRSPPFDDLDFEGFRPTFEALEELAARIV